MDAIQSDLEEMKGDRPHPAEGTLGSRLIESVRRKSLKNVERKGHGNEESHLCVMRHQMQCSR
jgi:hypothetical protein